MPVFSCRIGISSRVPLERSASCAARADLTPRQGEKGDVTALPYQSKLAFLKGPGLTKFLERGR